MTATTRVNIIGTDNTGKAFKSVQKNVTTVAGSVKNLTGLFGALGIGMSAVGGVSMLRGVIDAQDKLAKMSQQTGIAVESLAGLEFAASQSGTSLERVAKGTRAFSKIVLESSDASNKYSNILSALGLNLETLRESTPEEQFVKLAGALQDSVAPSERAAVITSLLGDRYAELIPLLAQGEEGLSRLIKEGQELNPVTAESAARAEVFNDNMDKLGRSLGAVGQMIAIEVTPTLIDLSDRLLSSVKAGTLFADTIENLLQLLSGHTVINLYKDALFGAEKATEKTTKATAKVADAVEDAATETVKAEKEYKSFAQILRDIEGKTGDVSKAKVKLKNGLTDEQKEAEKTANEIHALTLAYDPLIKRNERLAELTRLLGQGLSRDVFDAAAKDAINDYMRAIEQAEDATEQLDNTTDAYGYTARQVFDDVSQFSLQAARNIQTSLADALLDGISGFKSFSKSALNIIKRLAAEIASVKLLEGLGVGALLGGSGSAFASGGASGGGIGNLISSGFGLKDAFGSFATSGIGQSLGLSTVGPVAGFGELTGLGSIGSGLAAAAGPLAIGFAVDQIGRMLAGDKTTGTIVDKIPVIGGFASALFGRGPLKQQEGLIRGTVGAGGIQEDFLTSTRFKAKGGLLRGDKNDNVITSAITGALLDGVAGIPESGISKALLPFAEQAGEQAIQIGKVFDQATKGFNASLRNTADMLGIGAESLDTFSTWVQITSEKGEAVTEQQIAEEIERIGNEMANTLVPGLADLAKEGETALQAISRIGSEFKSLETTLMVFGVSASDANKAIMDLSISARTQLVDMAGGIEALNSKTAFFFDNFLTLEEKAEIAFNGVNAEMQKLGLSADITRDEFADLVQSVVQVGGVSTQTANALLNLAPRFSDLKNLQDELNAQAAASIEVNNDVNNVLNERLGLENRLLNVLGNTAEIRRRELEATDASNRSLVRRLHALEDEKIMMDRVGQAAQGVAVAVDAQKNIIAESLRARTDQSRSLVEGINAAILARENEKKAINESFGLALSANAELFASVSNTVSKLSGLSSLINTAVKTIAPISKADAENQVINAIARAKAGRFVDPAEITDAVNRLTQQTESEFATSLDMQRDAAQSRSLLDQLGGLTDSQLTIEQQTLESIKAQEESLRNGLASQIKRLDDIIAANRASIEAEQESLQRDIEAANMEMERLDSIAQFAENQLKELQGINIGVQSVAAAMQAFDFARGGATAKAIQDKQLSVGAVSDADIKTFFETKRTPQEIATAAIGNNVSAERIARVLGLGQEDIDKFFADNPDIPRFASGTSFVQRTGPAIVHQGERIINADQNADLINELKRANTALLQVIFNTGSVNRVVKRWDGAGLPEERSI